ncbi:MAG: carboxylating nicotinate-nucleotide diphosphorylase [Pseudomonadota bacterium]
MNTLSPHLDALIALALAEDLGPGDVTSLATIDDDAVARAEVRAKQDLVLAGVEVFTRVFERLDPRVQVVARFCDATRVRKGDVVLEVTGPTRSLLGGERVGLNFLMHLSGIATHTAQLRTRLKMFPTVALLDTRKTTPGLRDLEKAAVRAGGGVNHRHGLFDGVLIKDNHITAAGSVAAAVHLARRHAHHLLKVQVEASTLDQVEQALVAGADALLLDNMDDALLRSAVQVARALKPDAFLEASGNMTAERLSAVAATGVDAISMGGLTHSAVAVDLSMKLVPGQA